jgi:hypothetical protein
VNPKTPRPAAGRGAHRPAGFSEELFGGASKPEHINPQRHQQRIAYVRVFVARSGWIGDQIPECPICGDEHIHGPYRFFDPRERQGFAKFQINLSCAESLGWRSPHCSQSPRWPFIDDDVIDDGSEYELVLTVDPARCAPGAKSSLLAKQAMDSLRSIGFPTSNETLSSTWPSSKWKWLR